MTRYLRQTTVPAFGTAGQARLSAAQVLVVGAGGLGAPVLSYLAGAGLGRIRLVDPDHVALSNLHRQVLFRTEDLGQPKAEAAARHLTALNPECRVTPVVAPLDPASAPALFDGVDLVLDCADSFAVSFTLSDLCLARGLPLISASVTGTEGHVAGFCGGAPSIRAVFPDLPQRAGSCAQDGVLGPVVGVIGALQAQMALAVLAGIAPSPLGQMRRYDGLTHRMAGFAFHGAPEPEAPWPFVAASDLGPSDWVADLRQPDEGPLPVTWARRLSPDAPIPTEQRPEPGQRAVLVCASGLRAWRAAEHLSAVHHGPIALVALGQTPETL